MKGKVLGLDHLGVAVRDPRARLSLWADALGLTLDHVEQVSTEGVRVWFLPLDQQSAGPRIELLEPSDPKAPFAQSLERRGEGLHHVCLRVDDIEAVLAKLAARGLQPIGGGSRAGAHGTRVAFLHPRDTGGVLLELAESVAAPTQLSDFAAGALAVVYLQSPRERLLAQLVAIDAVGLTFDGLELDAWDSWLTQVAHGENGPIRPSRQFVPMQRVEKLIADQDSPELPSLARQFRTRTQRDLAIVFRGANEAEER